MFGYLISCVFFWFGSLIYLKRSSSRNLDAGDIGSAFILSLIWPFILVVIVGWYICDLIAKGINKL